MDFPNTYFRDAVESAAACYVRDGSLRERETFRYLVLAFPGGAGCSGPRRTRPRVRTRGRAPPDGPSRDGAAGCYRVVTVPDAAARDLDR